MNKKLLGWVLILIIVTGCKASPASITSPVPSTTPSKSSAPSQIVSTPLPAIPGFQSTPWLTTFPTQVTNISPTPWGEKTGGDELEIFANGYLADLEALNLSGTWLLVDYRQEGYFSSSERDIRPLLEKTLEFTTDDQIYFDGELCMDQPLLIKTVDVETYHRSNKIYLRSSDWDELGISSQTFRILWAERPRSWQCDSFKLGFGILSNPSIFVTHNRHTFFIFERILPNQPTPTPIPRTPLPPTPSVYCTPDSSQPYSSTLKDFFFEQARPAILEQDRETVSGLVRYPITVRIQGEDVDTHTPEEFLSLYDQIITEKVVSAVQQETDTESIFINWQGLKVGRGEIWIDIRYDDESMCSSRPGIYAINN